MNQKKNRRSYSREAFEALKLFKTLISANSLNWVSVISLKFISANSLKSELLAYTLNSANALNLVSVYSLFWFSSLLRSTQGLKCGSKVILIFKQLMFSFTYANVKHNIDREQAKNKEISIAKNSVNKLFLLLYISWLT